MKNKKIILTSILFTLMLPSINSIAMENKENLKENPKVDREIEDFEKEQDIKNAEEEKEKLNYLKEILKENQDRVDGKLRIVNDKENDKIYNKVMEEQKIIKYEINKIDAELEKLKEVEYKLDCKIENLKTHLEVENVKKEKKELQKKLNPLKEDLKKLQDRINIKQELLKDGEKNDEIYNQIIAEQRTIENEIFYKNKEINRLKKIYDKLYYEIENHKTYQEVESAKKEKEKLLEELNNLVKNLQELQNRIEIRQGLLSIGEKNDKIYNQIMEEQKTIENEIFYKNKEFGRLKRIYDELYYEIENLKTYQEVEYAKGKKEELLEKSNKLEKDLKELQDRIEKRKELLSDEAKNDKIYKQIIAEQKTIENEILNTNQKIGRLEELYERLCREIELRNTEQKVEYAKKAEEKLLEESIQIMKNLQELKNRIEIRQELLKELLKNGEKKPENEQKIKKIKTTFATIYKGKNKKHID